MTKTLLVQLLSLAGRPTPQKVLIVSDFFHFTVIEATVGTPKTSTERSLDFMWDLIYADVYLSK